MISLPRPRSPASLSMAKSSTPAFRVVFWCVQPLKSGLIILTNNHPITQSDGIGGFVSALFTVTPLSIFAQNNGVIAITRCANRTAGRFCCFFLILFGVLGKISGVFLASKLSPPRGGIECSPFAVVPNSVLGGVTTFLFATVATSGIRVLSYNRFTRRERFILAAAFSFGFGDLLVHGIFTHLFDGVVNPSSGLRGLFDSITIVLSTPCEYRHHEYLSERDSLLI